VIRNDGVDQVPPPNILAPQFPQIAEIARLPLRAWNAMRSALANAAIWLIALGVIVRRLPTLRAPLKPTIVVCIALELGLLATAPISEGRCGLLILVTGQLTLLYVAVARQTAMRR